MDDLNGAVAEVRPEPKRDRYGRYLIPHPDTGKETAWTRATTFAKTVSDTFGLTKWELRMVSLGLAKRPDLLAQVAGVLDPDDRDAKRLLDGIAAQAKEAAGSTTRSNLGTALHTMTEHIDAGRDFTVPEAHAADLDAYRSTTAALHIDPAHIERIVTVPAYNVAGTLDRLATVDGRLVVADLKTGRTLAGVAEYAIQLALYANAATMWDPTTGEHEPMPEVDKEQALIIWLPAGEARCELHTVDIAAGWEMAQTCETVRTWRKRRDLSRIYTGAHEEWVEDPDSGNGAIVRVTTTNGQVTEVASTPEPNHVEPPFPDHKPATADEWITGRIETLVASRAAKAMLAQHWPAGTPKRAPWTDEQVDAIVPVLERIETAVEAPFPYDDPRPRPATHEDAAPPSNPRTWDRPDDGGPVDEASREALKALAAKLPVDRAQLCSPWRADAKRYGTPWGGVTEGGAWSARCFADNRAAVACVTNLWDDDDPDVLTRAALTRVITKPRQPLQADGPTGALIGSLSVEEADELAWIAEAFGRGDAVICADLGQRITAA